MVFDNAKDLPGTWLYDYRNDRQVFIASAEKVKRQTMKLVFVSFSERKYPHYSQINIATGRTWRFGPWPERQKEGDVKRAYRGMIKSTFQGTIDLS